MRSFMHLPLLQMYPSWHFTFKHLLMMVEVQTPELQEVPNGQAGLHPGEVRTHWPFLHVNLLEHFTVAHRVSFEIISMH